MTDTRINRDPNPLRLYAIIRNDLGMDKYKMSAQTGHAYVDAAEDCMNRWPAVWKRYKTAHGIKICLAANAEEFEQAKQALLDYNIPIYEITDLGYTHFNGVPTVTALGFGPCYKNELPTYIQDMKLPSE